MVAQSDNISSPSVSSPSEKVVGKEVAGAWDNIAGLKSFVGDIINPDGFVQRRLQGPLIEGRDDGTIARNVDGCGRVKEKFQSVVDTLGSQADSIVADAQCLSRGALLNLITQSIQAASDKRDETVSREGWDWDAAEKTLAEFEGAHDWTHPPEMHDPIKFWSVLGIFCIVEAAVNGIFYAQVLDGLLEGWAMAALIAVGVIGFGLLSGLCASFLRGFKKSHGPPKGGSPTAQWMVVGILVIIALIGGVYFYQHSQDLIAKHGVRGTLIVVGAVVVLVALVMYFCVGKGGDEAAVTKAQQHGYVPRPIWQRLLCGLGSLLSLVIGFCLIMFAYLYREEMLGLGDELFDKGAQGKVMGRVRERFAMFDFLPKADPQSIGLLVVNFFGFGLAVWKGFFAMGEYPGCNSMHEKYKKAEEHWEQVKKETQSELNTCYNWLNRLIAEAQTVIHQIEGLCKRGDDYIAMQLDKGYEEARVCANNFMKDLRGKAAFDVGLLKEKEASVVIEKVKRLLEIRYLDGGDVSSIQQKMDELRPPPNRRHEGGNEK